MTTTADINTNDFKVNETVNLVEATESTDSDVIYFESEKQEVISNLNTVSENSMTSTSITQPQNDVTKTTTLHPSSRVVVFQSQIVKMTGNTSDIAQTTDGKIVMRSRPQFVSAIAPKLTNTTKTAGTISTVTIPVSSTTTAASGKSQIMLQTQKSLNNSLQSIVPVSVSTPNGPKQQFAYLGTILKPVMSGSSKQEGQIITHLPVGLVPAPTNQKLVITPINAPTKLANANRRASSDTASTAISQSKFTNILLPLPANSTATSKPKATGPMINLKITNGQLQSDHKGAITVLCDNQAVAPKLPPLQPLPKPTLITTCTTSVKPQEEKETDSTKPANACATEKENVNKPSASDKQPTKPAPFDNGVSVLKPIPMAEKEYTLSIPENDSTFLDANPSYEVSIKENSTDLVEVTCTISSSKNAIPRRETIITSITKPTQIAVPIATDNSHERRIIDDTVLSPVKSQSLPDTPVKKVHEIAILKKPKLSFQEADWKKSFIEKNKKSECSKLPVDTEKMLSTESEKPVEKIDKISEVTKTIVTERRRKSHNTILKDYDEIEFTPESPEYNFTDVKISKLKSQSDEENKFSRYNSNSDVTFKKISMRDEISKEMATKSKLSLDDIQIEVIKKELPPVELTMEDFDPSKVLEWNDGIGALPGSDLKFHMNEFGFMEVITDNDVERVKQAKKEVESKITKARQKAKKHSDKQVYCCEGCGCYGMLAEFISPTLCSYMCAEKCGRPNAKLTKKDRKLLNIQKKLENNNDDYKRSASATPAQSDDDNNSNDTNKEGKYMYPWFNGKKGFSWAKYLEHMKAKSAPVKLFKDPFPYYKNGFRVGMKLEGIDPQHQSRFCVLTVSDINGYRMRLHFDGYGDAHDFWVNADSLNIFPPGWCERNGHRLQPPFGYTPASFNWNNYLRQCRSTPAPKHLFTSRPENSVCPNGFRIGMKLEAVDRKHCSLICVATVNDIMDNRILVHFDSWDEIYDYWADPASPYIHPVGWCDEKGHHLTPPNDFKDPENFSWEEYLKVTKSQAAPARAFKQRPPSGFRKGMKLECVDPRVPKFIRVSTVDDVKDHQIRISFDGWPDKYSFWIDDNSTDIHPMGWCAKTSHPLQPPLTPEDIYNSECSTPGCRGLGHAKGPHHDTHHSQSSCPYSDENLNKDLIPDRLASKNQTEKPEEAVPVSREPKRIAADSTVKIVRPPKRKPADSGDESDEKGKKVSKKKRKRSAQSPDDDDSSNNFNIKLKSTESIMLKNVHQDNFDPAVIPDPNNITPFCWEKHSKNLKNYINNSTNPLTWNEEEVVNFVNNIPSCKELSCLFSKHKIDGESLLMLSQSDLVSILGFKLGPAIKLYNSIMLLRQNSLLYS